MLRAKGSGRPSRVRLTPREAPSPCTRPRLRGERMELNCFPSRVLCCSPAGSGVYVTRRHRRAAGLGIAAATCCVVSFALGGYGQTGALAASGGATWPYALDIPMSLISMMLLLPGSVVVIALGFNGVPHPYVVFNSPPGWESGESGWLPFAGWFPPQHWPAAPQDWQFLTPVRKKKANGNTSRWARATARAWQNQYRARAALTTEPGAASGD